MRILIHGINFHPEPTGIGKYSGEMAEDLARRGHEVRVVTAPPYYPDWKISEGWSNGYSRQQHKGVDVFRAPLWVPKKPTGKKRVLHLASFAVLAWPQLLRQLFWRPDVVMVVAPAIACVPWAWMLARVTGASAWLHVQDFEVDAAYRLGMLNSKGRRKGWLVGMERWLLRRFDRVSTISEAMLKHTRNKGVDADKVFFLPNWVNDQAIKPLKRRSTYRDELNIRDDQIVCLFSGTMGGKQGLELLPQAAKQLAAREDIVFVICGDGVVKPQIEEATQGMANVRLLPLQPFERLNELLGMADIHMLTQHPGAADLVMPSKLGGMLASGRAVVTTAEPGTELANVVQACGKVVPPGDLPAFAGALCELADDALLRQSLGREARRLAEEHLGQVAVLDRLEKELKATLPGITEDVEDAAAEGPQA